MGRLTQAFAYLTEDPKKLIDIKESLTHITVDENLKKLRKKLKLYKLNPK